jgi:hypothetical protein
VTEKLDTAMHYGVDEGANGGFARGRLLQRLPLDA